LLLVSASLKLHQLLTAATFVSNDWLASQRVQWLAAIWIKQVQEYTELAAKDLPPESK
jgi:hypothetical protein